MKTTIAFLIVTIGVALAFPGPPTPIPGHLKPVQGLKGRNGEALPPPPGSQGAPSPAELKKFHDSLEKDAEGNPILPKGADGEGLEGAESFGYGYYGYYPYYSYYYPRYYYPSYYRSYWW